MKKIRVLFLLFLLPFACDKHLTDMQNGSPSGIRKAITGTDYYVAPPSAGGLDTKGRGTSPDEPWASPAYAAARVTKRGDRIHMAAGQYAIVKQVKLSPGVSLLGADKNDASKTVLLAAGPLDGAPKTSMVHLDNKSSWQKTLEGDQDIRDFTLQVEEQASFGIFVIGLHRVRITNVVIKDAAESGIVNTSYWFAPASWDSDDYAEGCEISFCHVISCAGDQNYPNGGNSHNIETRGWRGGSVHHNVVTDVDEGDRGGFGIGGMYVDGIHVFANHVTVGIDNPVWKGMFSMEYRHLANNCEFYENELSNCVSMVGEGHLSDGSQRSLTFHHNFINAPDENEVEMVECIADYAEYAYNHFIGGGVTFLFSNKAGNEGLVTDQWMHHNVHYNGNGIVSAFSDGRKENVYIYNNTFYDLENNGNEWRVSSSGFYWNGPCSNIVIANNIIAHIEDVFANSPSLLNINSNATLDQFVFQNNLVFDYGKFRKGDQNQEILLKDNLVDIDPGLIEAGERPDPYFRPIDDKSPVIGNGTLEHLPENASTTIGRYEYDPVISRVD